MKTKLLKKYIGLLLFLFIGFSANAHVTEIRVNQNQDGTLTWYLTTYHYANSCGHDNAGLLINGVQYNISSEHAGSAEGLSPTVFAVSPYLYTYGGRQSYAIVNTPYIPGNLNVAPYSNNACWAFLVGGNGSFTPPPPPVCTISPINTWSNTIGVANNNGTDCDPTDDTLSANITVNHLSCGSITNAGTFSVYLDPAGANTLLGSYAYATGITTNATINLPYGFDANTAIKVVDDSFGASPVTHALSGLPNTFNGVPSTSVPSALVNNFSINLNASGNATITAADVDAGSSDACGPVVLSIDKSTFTCANIGPNPVTLTVTSPSGNQSTATATVTVVDNIAPVIVAPADFSVFATSGNGALVNYTAPVATDNCSVVSPTMIAGLADGATFPIGITAVTYTATDDAGNTATATFNVEVVGIAPVLGNMENITVSNDPGICGASVNYTATETVVGIPAATITYDIAPNSTFAKGTTTVTATATNAIGSSSVSFDVTVNDTENPTVITKDFTIALVNGIANITSSDINNGTFDNCDFTLGINLDTFTCADIGDQTVTLTATDASGNTSSNTATVTIEGAIPEITISDFTAVQSQKTNTIFLGYGPESINLSTSTTGGTSFTYQWTSSTGEYVENVANPSISPKVSTTYTVVATNNYGCTTTSSIEVCVIDARSYNKKGKLDGKVLVCHHTYGKKGTKHVLISISYNAVGKHISNHGEETEHGDTLGECNATCVTSSTGGNKPIPKANNAESTFVNLELQVYPNPSNGVFQIKIANLKAGTEFNLIDVTGKLVSRKIITTDALSKSITIGNRNLPSGIYILKIISTEEIITKKLIINQN